MENKRLEYLLQQYVTKQSSPEETSELYTLLSDQSNDQAVKAYMSELWDSKDYSDKLDEEESRKMLSSIIEEPAADVITLASRPRSKKRWWPAAAVLLIAIGAASAYFLKSPVEQPVVKTTSPIIQKNDVAPGSTGAILKLDNGEAIVLDSATDGQLAQQNNMVVMKESGTINYVASNESKPSSIGYNSIETPRGRQYQIVLSDGTKVWLNAASSIRFPVAFTGSERKVEVSGEVYFEVAKNTQMPFRVAANGTIVEVLGTHFNVNAYHDESKVNVTLLEGSVNVSNANSNQLIKPGEQARLTESGSINLLKNVDTEQIMAWKNGMFVFEKAGIETIMRQLSRWYDVEVEYSNNKSNDPLYAEISRNTNLSNVLKALEMSGGAKFKIEGKKITVL